MTIPKAYLTQPSTDYKRKKRLFSESTDGQRELLRAWRPREEEHFSRSLRKAGIKFDTKVPYLRCFLDFQIVPHRIAVEVEGKVHKTPDRIQKDKDRDTLLANGKWTVLRFKDYQVKYSISYVLWKIKEAIAMHESWQKPAIKLVNSANANRIVVVPPTLK